MSTPLQPFPAASRLVRAEHVVMAGAALALVVLVALPLACLVAGSVTSEGGVTLAHFRDALSSRLYVQALRNSLILGAATTVLSVAVGLPLAWPVSRTNVLAKRFLDYASLVPLGLLGIVGRASAVARAERAGVAQ
jgi:ABC-type Fe3+ transport system permease subunit